MKKVRIDIRWRNPGDDVIHGKCLFFQISWSCVRLRTEAPKQGHSTLRREQPLWTSALRLEKRDHNEKICDVKLSF